MYLINSLESAINRLFRDGVGEHGYTSEEVVTMLHGIDFEALLQAVRHHAMTSYSYITQGKTTDCFNYRGKELFEQRAILFYRDTDQSCADFAVVTRSYELWLLEDMDIVAVACVSVKHEDSAFLTEYREVKDGNPWDSGMYLDLEILVQELDDLCADFYANNIPVYEL